MKVTVKFMSQFRTLAGVEKATIELPKGTTAAKLLHALCEPYPDISPVVRHATIMVNHRIVTPESVLGDGDEVVLLQLLGGG
jgi:molybdopterin converting factor small subunit